MLDVEYCVRKQEGAIFTQVDILPCKQQSLGIHVITASQERSISLWQRV